MKTNTSIKLFISEKFDKSFSQFPVSIQESPEGANTLWICVFAVPSDQIRPVKNFIHAIQSELLAESDILLLPMVKNLETTRQYYPEYLPQEPAFSVVQIAEQFLLKKVLVSYKCQSAPFFSELYDDEYHTSSAHLGFEFSNTMTYELQPTRTGEVEVTANHELALAA